MKYRDLIKLNKKNISLICMIKNIYNYVKLKENKKKLISNDTR